MKAIPEHWGVLKKASDKDLNLVAESILTCRAGRATSGGGFLTVYEQKCGYKRTSVSLLYTGCATSPKHTGTC